MELINGGMKANNNSKKETKKKRSPVQYARSNQGLTFDAVTDEVSPQILAQKRRKREKTGVVDEFNEQVPHCP